MRRRTSKLCSFVLSVFSPARSKKCVWRVSPSTNVFRECQPCDFSKVHVFFLRDVCGEGVPKGLPFHITAEHLAALQVKAPRTPDVEGQTWNTTVRIYPAVQTFVNQDQKPNHCTSDFLPIWCTYLHSASWQKCLTVNLIQELRRQFQRLLWQLRVHSWLLARRTGIKEPEIISGCRYSRLVRHMFPQVLSFVQNADASDIADGNEFIREMKAKWGPRVFFVAFDVLFTEISQKKFACKRNSKTDDTRQMRAKNCHNLAPCRDLRNTTFSTRSRNRTVPGTVSNSKAHWSDFLANENCHLFRLPVFSCCVDVICESCVHENKLVDRKSNKMSITKS